MTGPSVHRGFTLIELLVSVALIAGIMAIVIAVTHQLSDLWRGTAAKIEQFSEARNAFESLTRRLSQATLNTYWDYDDPDTPSKYVRKSDLRFLCQPGAGGSHEVFFQAPFGYRETVNGLNNVLNTWGYYVEYGDDTASRPPFVQFPPRWRFRLLEYMEPSERFTVYSQGQTWAPPDADGRRAYAHVLAENVIALVLLPRLSPQEDASGTKLAPEYAYDSVEDGKNGGDPNFNTRNQLPPIVQLTLVAIDEASALRMTAADVTAIRAKLNGLFRDAQNHDADLTGEGTSLEAELIARKIKYHFFTTNVILRGAKWSRQ